MTIGKLTSNGMRLNEHEYITLNVLLGAGYDIELLKPSLTKYVKTGDFVMMGLIWEMKSPIGKSPRTMEHVFRKAAKQAPNLVIDLVRARVSEEMAINILRRLLKISRTIRRVWIITKKREIIKMEK